VADAVGMLDYERLDVYKCAIEHLSLVLTWLPRLKRGNSAVADEWRRAAMSIPLNIGEASGKVSPAERTHCYQIARGEAMECGAILDVVHLLALAPDGDLDRAKELISRIVSMLTKMAR
jgi:four helix bundle protein